jgi:hypothetical protein
MGEDWLLKLGPFYPGEARASKPFVGKPANIYLFVRVKRINGLGPVYALWGKILEKRLELGSGFKSLNPFWEDKGYLVSLRGASYIGVSDKAISVTGYLTGLPKLVCRVV